MFVAIGLPVNHRSLVTETIFYSVWQKKVAPDIFLQVKLCFDVIVLIS